MAYDHFFCGLGIKGSTKCNYGHLSLSNGVWKYTTRPTYFILKEVWDNEIEKSDTIGMEPLDYLKKLMENLRQALDYADKHARIKHTQYVDQHNKTSKEKSFEPGEFVVVLYPTSSNKLLSKWHGPCQILQKKSKHSYLVDMHDQGSRIIHANKLMKIFC